MFSAIDPNTKTVDKSDEIEPNVSLPIRYIFGIDNREILKIFL